MLSEINFSLCLSFFVAAEKLGKRRGTWRAAMMPGPANANFLFPALRLCNAMGHPPRLLLFRQSTLSTLYTRLRSFPLYLFH